MIICYKCSLIFHDENSYKQHLKSHENLILKRKFIEEKESMLIKKTKLSAEEISGRSALCYITRCFYFYTKTKLQFEALGCFFINSNDSFNYLTFKNRIQVPKHKFD